MQFKTGAIVFGLIFSIFIIASFANPPKASAQAGTCTPGDPTCGTVIGVTPLPADPKQYASPKEGQLGCGWDSKFDAAVCLSNVVYAFTVGLGSGLAYVGGFIFDITVALSLNSAAYALDFLSSGWTIARDLANMAFVLILVYIAFTIMFQAETAGTMRMLALVIFIALIINFSFFLTRVVIDTGNILAVQFYNFIDAPTMQKSINATNSSAGTLANTATGIANYVAPQNVFANTKDLTASIMQVLNIQQLFSSSQFDAFIKGQGFGTKFITLVFIYIGVGACYFILAAIFFAVGIKFLMRIVILWLLIIASPLAFVAKAIPRGEVSAWYDTWQHELVNHAFYPAFFLFIFLFISTIMAGLAGPGNMLVSMTADINKLSNENIGGTVFIVSSMASVAIRLGFIVALLYAALKASEFMGVQGANIAHNVTGWVSRAGTGAVFGGAGWAGRNTVGWAGQRFNTSTTGRNLAARGGFLGRTLWRGAGALGRQSFDLRGMPGVRSGLGKLNIDTRNPSGQGGYAAAYAQKIANREREAGQLAPSRLAVERAEQAAIQQLERQTPGFSRRLVNATNELREARDERDRVGDDASRRRFAAAERALNPLRNQINAIARTLAGSGNRGVYADSISQRSLRNLWGAAQGTPGWISRADQEAAIRIRGNENDVDRLHAIVGRMGLRAAPVPPSLQNPPNNPTPGGGQNPRTAANTNNPQPPQPPNTPAPGGAGAPVPPGGPAIPTPANSNTRQGSAGGGATSTVTRTTPLWGTGARQTNSLETERLANEVQRLREAIHELPNRLTEEGRASALRNVVVAASNDNRASQTRPSNTNNLTRNQNSSAYVPPPSANDNQNPPEQRAA